MRLVGADEHIYAFHVDSLQWLADTDLLEMLVEKLSPPVLPSSFNQICVLGCKLVTKLSSGKPGLLGYLLAFLDVLTLPYLLRWYQARMSYSFYS